MTAIRQETPSDVPGIRRVNVQAFGGPGEADLVDAIRTNDAVTLSLVAVDDGEVVGHIFFSPVEVETGDAICDGVGLGPMAVLPDMQRMGIGSQLVRRGLELLREQGYPFAVVLGHPEYYPRFGFVPASRLGLACTYDVPDEVFMASELRESSLKDVRGVVRYRREFDDV